MGSGSDDFREVDEQNGLKASLEPAEKNNRMKRLKGQKRSSLLYPVYILSLKILKCLRYARLKA